MKKKLNFKCLCLSLILIMVFTITLLISYKTKLNSHPDEQYHYYAVNYYQNHFFPPKFTANEIAYTFSQYGESRLTELDAYYFFAGKYTNFINLISHDLVFNMRSFNLILLLIILILCFKLYINKSYLFIPFLLSSQLWYLFSYINNDAWAIFLNLIFVYQLFYKKSIFNKLINTSEENMKKNKIIITMKFILLGLLFYFLLIVKINYLISLGMTAIIYLIVNRKICFKKNNLLKIMLILLIGFSFFGVRIGLDFSINGTDRLNMEPIRLLRASDAYKPPYTADRFKFKEKGESIDVIIKNDLFYDQLKKSFIGLYGYMNKPILSKNFYKIVEFGYIIFFICMVKDNKKNLIPIILTLISGILIFSLVVYRSYVYDFQAQGRYLFPIIPIICANLYSQKKSNLMYYSICVVAILLIIMYYKYGYCALI